jgi:hypothetical protein
VAENERTAAERKHPHRGQVRVREVSDVGNHRPRPSRVGSYRSAPVGGIGEFPRSMIARRSPMTIHWPSTSTLSCAGLLDVIENASAFFGILFAPCMVLFEQIGGADAKRFGDAVEYFDRHVRPPAILNVGPRLFSGEFGALRCFRLGEFRGDAQPADFVGVQRDVGLIGNSHGGQGTPLRVP